MSALLSEGGCEAEEMADRIGIIHRGEIVLVDDKTALMRQLGKKQLRLSLAKPLKNLPDALQEWNLELTEGGHQLSYTFLATDRQQTIVPLMRLLDKLHIDITDLDTRESTLEEIFVDLVKQREGASA